jgi:hypothetical protein
VQGVADREGLLETGDLALCIAEDVVRPEGDERVGGVGAAAITGAAAAALDLEGALLDRGQSALAVDGTKCLAPESQDEGGDRAVAPPPADDCSRDEPPAVRPGRWSTRPLADGGLGDEHADLHGALGVRTAQPVLQITADEARQRVVEPLAAPTRMLGARQIGAERPEVGVAAVAGPLPGVGVGRVARIARGLGAQGGPEPLAGLEVEVTAEVAAAPSRSRRAAR